MGFFQRILGGGRRKDTNSIENTNAGAQPEPGGNFEAELTFKAVGNMNDVCPYCDAELAKRPGKKVKCPHCGNSIYVRKRANGDERALMTGAQTCINDCQKLTVEWNKSAGTGAIRSPDIAHHKKLLSEKFGFEPSFNDILWSAYNQKIEIYFNKRQYIKLRFVHQGMAQHLIAEGKLTNSLHHLFMVCLIDLSGYRDDLSSYSIEDDDLENFMPILQGHIIGLIMRVAEAEQIDKATLEKRILDAITPHADHFNVDPKEAWDKVSAKVYSDS